MKASASETTTSGAAGAPGSPENFRLRFPLGAQVTLEELERDPYPFFVQAREREPITWVQALGMWYVTRYEDVRNILLDTQRFTTAWEHSTIYDTFGAHMLTTEGDTHKRFRRAMQHAFLAQNVARLEPAIRTAARQLVESFKATPGADLRSCFASRLPIHTILLTFGIPLAAEPHMRRWYDSFEQALANFSRDPHVREQARRNVAEFHAFLRERIAAARTAEDETYLATILNAPDDRRLSEDEIVRNLSIIFFGGISTVEALILNSLWALTAHPAALERVRADRALIPQALDETMRWLSPVQSATRHVVGDTQFLGVSLRAGDTLNCMLGAANHDPRVFSSPERFDIDRANAASHLGFATGVHMCLGFRLARAQVRIALEVLLDELPGLVLMDRDASAPTGYEFRQPRAMHVSWTPNRSG